MDMMAECYPTSTNISLRSLSVTDKEALKQGALSIASRIGWLGRVAGREYDRSQLVLGVRISCKFHMNRDGIPRYSVFESPRRDFLSRVRSPYLFERIQLPLTVSVTNTDLTNPIYTNPLAEQLFRVADTESPDFCKYPILGHNPGDVLVFRRDGKELRPEHVKALIEWVFRMFSMREAEGMTQGPQESDAEYKQRLKEKFNAGATKKGFEAYWRMWKRHGMSDEPSPYEM
ncbi:MAG: hypothetical protein Q9216_006179 [Gyalolechia sp. 2 TL-2023]